MFFSEKWTIDVIYLYIFHSHTTKCPSIPYLFDTWCKYCITKIYLALGACLHVFAASFGFARLKYVNKQKIRNLSSLLIKRARPPMRCVNFDTSDMAHESPRITFCWYAKNLSPKSNSRWLSFTLRRIYKNVIPCIIGTRSM